jgi:hypothetical protein
LLVFVGTIFCAYVTKLLVGLRPTEEVEMSGLDSTEHGEEGYHSENKNPFGKTHGGRCKSPAVFFNRGIKRNPHETGFEFTAAKSDPRFWLPAPGFCMLGP